MLKIYPKIIIGLLLVGVALQAYSGRLALKTSNSNAVAFKRAEALEVAQAKLTQQELEKQALKVFTLKVMDMSPKTRLSGDVKEQKANKIVDKIYNNIIDGQEARETYIAMLKAENNFYNDRKSPAGAVGISQIMISTYKISAEDCGLQPNVEDLNNEDINLEFGSCYYQLLLNENDNNPRLATLSYNGGAKVVEQFRKLGDVNSESANYGLKVAFIKDQINVK